MSDIFSRTRMLVGSDALRRLDTARILVFGIGGVGSFTVEALVRAGVGDITVVDNDMIDVTNINRQLFALHSTIGRYKVDVARERLLDINPQLSIHCSNIFLSAETAQQFDFSAYDYVVDAIDTVSAKLLIVQKCAAANTPLISSMGTGNKLRTDFEIADIFDTSGCPLARVMRRELRRLGIGRLTVVYSKEEPRVASRSDDDVGGTRPVPGSISYCPSSAGLMIAGHVIRDIMNGGAENG